jgi:hypothetical protein
VRAASPSSSVDNCGRSNITEGGKMNHEQSGTSVAGPDTKLRTSLALAGMAATLSMPAGAAIVSITDLEKHIAPGESYSLPGIPTLEFSTQSVTDVDKYGAVHVSTYGSFSSHPIYDNSGPKSQLVSGAWAGVSRTFNGVFGPDSVFAAGDVMGPSDSVFYSSLSHISGYDDAYFSLMFGSQTEMHYGWVHFSFAQGSSDFVIHGFGYNDEPFATIRAGETSQVPEPSTLALLACGVIAAGSVRRRSAQR